MLGKLIKYEYKATGRVFLPLYAVLVLYTLLGRLVMNLEPVQQAFGGMIGGLMLILYVCLIVAVLVVTVVMAIQRFYKNLLGDEGYLSHTLPVSTNGLVTSKLLVAISWMVVSVALVAASLLLLVGGVEIFADLRVSLANLSSQLDQVGIAPWAFWAELAANLLVQLLANFLMFYAAMSIGQLFRQKVAGSFLAYLGLNMASQTLLVVGLMVLAALNLPYLRELFAEPSNQFPPAGMWHGMMLGTLVYNALLGAACFVASKSLLKRKLNLE
ncbi:MAG: hypothetical protein ACOYJA_12495 [Christensenellales bacterium]|jgi:hypothetical protein